MYSIKKTVAAMVGIGMLVPAFALADTNTSAIQALLEQIKALQAQIKTLQEQHTQVVQQTQEVLKEFRDTMREGDKGENVRQLQELLAQDPELYPEGIISGYYGRLTSEAIKRFQKKHGIEQVGAFGPKTLKRFNEIFGRRVGSSTVPTWNNGVGNSWKNDNDDEDDDDDVKIEDRSFRYGKVTICHKPGKSNETIYVAASAVSAHLHHGDRFGACSGGSSNGSDTTAPVISGVAANGILSSGATINWSTNEAATSQVEYGTTSAYGSTSVYEASLITSHGIGISGLSASTTYHYRVISKDAAGNTATSSDQTFKTSTVADTTAPNISTVVASNITTSAATITWGTDEAGTSQVEYGTTNAYGFMTTLDTALVTSHSVALAGLTANTLYHFRVYSKDASSNQAISSDFTFTTAAPDVTAPSISAVSASTSASTATITWSTNESATSKVYYSSTDPVNTGTAASASDPAFVTSHSLGLTGLSASTTYYYIVESTDASSNTATSPQLSLMTQ